MAFVGIDAGSARMHVAVVRGPRAVPVPLKGDATFIPTVVARKAGTTLIGAPARAHLLAAPRDVVFGPLRLLGGGPVAIGHETRSPEELCAWLYQAGAAAAVALTGEECRSAGLVLPPPPIAAGDVLKAATLAGLRPMRAEVPSLLAAMAYSFEGGHPGLVAVVDAGAWKVEAALVTMGRDGFAILGRAVDASTGASWLDGRLVRALAYDLGGERPGRLIDDPVVYAMLRAECEAARIALSTAQTASLNLPFLQAVLGSPRTPALERARVETIAGPLLSAVEEVCQQACREADLPPTAAQNVLLVGGLSRMPALRARIAGVFGRDPSVAGDTEGMVARGAAFAAAIAAGVMQPTFAAQPAGRSAAFAPAGPAPSGVRETTRMPVARPPPVDPAAPRARRTTPPPVDPAAPRARRTTPPPVDPAAPADSGTDERRSTRRTPVSMPAVEKGRAASVPTAASTALPPQGVLAFPSSPADLLALHLGSATLPVGVSPLPLPVLLAALARLPALGGSLVLEGKELIVIGVQGGAFFGTQRERELVRGAFCWTEGRYQVLASAPPETASKRERDPLLAALVRGIRFALRAVDRQILLAALAQRADLAPRIPDMRQYILKGLALPDRERRFAEHELDAKAPLGEIMSRSAISSETTVPLVIALEMLGVIEWTAPPVRVGVTLAERLRERLASIERADHFEVLGVHWSVTTQEIEAAYRRIVKELGPGSPARAEAAAVADRILQRARLAHAAVIDEIARREYIATTYKTDFRAVSALLAARADSLDMRGEKDAAEDSKRLGKEMDGVVRIQREHYAAKVMESIVQPPGKETSPSRTGVKPQAAPAPPGAPAGKPPPGAGPKAK